MRLKESFGKQAVKFCFFALKYTYTDYCFRIQLNLINDFVWLNLDLTITFISFSTIGNLTLNELKTCLTGQTQITGICNIIVEIIFRGGVKFLNSGLLNLRRVAN